MKLTKPYIQPCRGEAHRKLLDVLNYSNVSKLCSLKGIGKQVGCPLLCVCVCGCVCMRVCAFVHECVCEFVRANTMECVPSPKAYEVCF